MNLKEIRTKKGMSQAEVAKLIHCSANVYSRYERGERQPSIETLIQLSEIFHVSVDYIIGNEPDTEVLVEQEFNFLHAFREADNRARKDAWLLLQQHKIY